MRIAAGLLTAGLVLAGWELVPAAGRAAAQDDLGGLPKAPGQEEVFYLCNACHSIRLVTQQRCRASPGTGSWTGWWRSRAWASSPPRTAA